ncbi:MAG: hypothetical protein AAGC67_06725, partial [Myxococcota bacterium]
EDALEAAADPAAAAAPAVGARAAQGAASREFGVAPPSGTPYPVDPPVRDAAASPVAQAEILEAELTPLDAADAVAGEPIEDAFVELLEE